MELKHPVLPLDLAMLDTLPDEGTLMGYHVVGKTVRALAKELSMEGAPVTSGDITSRVRVCKLNGLVVDIEGARGGIKLWQRTKKGEQLVAERGVPAPGMPAVAAGEGGQ